MTQPQRGDAPAYANVMVAVDNSEWSSNAVDVAVDLARATGAHLTGVHVYASRLHDARFRQLEPGLPDRYQAEEILRRQRDIHDDLIGRGLKLISDSYLDVFEEKCRRAGVVAERKTPEGRNYEQLVRDARESRYDLVVVGAHGLGHVDRSTLGSVCERVTRLAECDVLVVRDGRPLGSGGLLVAIDGSAHSFGALDAALDISLVYASQVSAVAAYDPFFHGVAFKSIAGVISGEAARLFRFREQEQLHDEIIDRGLAEAYRAHLVQARRIASRRGVALQIELLEGKPFDAIARHVERVRPAALVVGRVGVHHGEGVTLGSTAENLLRLVGCNVLVVGRTADGADPEAAGDEAAAAGPEIRWHEEAERRLERIPPFARPMARRAIEEFARTNGHAEITLEVYEQARQRFRG